MKIIHSSWVAAIALSSVVAGASAACTSAMDVHSMTAANVTFDHFRSFAFDPKAGAPLSYEPSPQSAQVRAHIQETTVGILQSRGYVLASGTTPDLVVRIEAGRREPRKPEPVLAPPEQVQIEYRDLLDNEEQDLVEGAFVIDAFDKQSGKLVWHGAARSIIVDPNQVDYDRLQHSVEKVLASFPARPPH